MKKLLNFLNRRALGAMLGLLIIPVLVHLAEWGVYRFAPVELFVDYHAIVPSDITTKDLTQIWRIERTVTVEVTGIYVDEANCRPIDTQEWQEYVKLNGKAIYGVGESETVVVPLPYTLPEGECYWVTHIDLLFPNNVTRSVTNIVSTPFQVTP